MQTQGDSCGSTRIGTVRRICYGKFVLLILSSYLISSVQQVQEEGDIFITFEKFSMRSLHWANVLQLPWTMQMMYEPQHIFSHTYLGFQHFHFSICTFWPSLSTNRVIDQNTFLWQNLYMCRSTWRTFPNTTFRNVTKIAVIRSTTSLLKFWKQSQEFNKVLKTRRENVST